MFRKETKKQEEKEKAIKSGDPNRILWLFDRAAARILFQYSLNVTTASGMSDGEILKLKGAGLKTLSSIRMAAEKAKK
jgi:hypothetical protein